MVQVGFKNRPRANVGPSKRNRTLSDRAACFGNVQAAQYLKITGHVNTYTFTKMLTEMAIAEFHNHRFPVAIVRPSVVVRCQFCLLPQR